MKKLYGETKLCMASFTGMMLLCLLFVFCIYFPQQAEITEKDIQLKKQQIKLEEINDFLKIHGDSESYRQKMEELYHQADIRLPSQMGQGAFLITLQEKALLQNIQLTSILPGKEELHGVYLVLPVQIGFRCTYFQLIHFLQALEEAERFFSVRSVNVHAFASQELECKLELLVYSFVG